MPAYNDTREFEASENWVLITASDVESLTFKNLSYPTFWLAASIGAVAPTSRDVAIPVGPGEGEIAMTLADAFPGVVGANRVYILAPKGGRGFFSHA